MRSASSQRARSSALLGTRLVVLCPIVLGRRVVLGADLLQRPREILVVVLRAQEHHVLEEVREPGPARLSSFEPTL